MVSPSNLSLEKLFRPMPAPEKLPSSLTIFFDGWYSVVPFAGALPVLFPRCYNECLAVKALVDAAELGAAEFCTFFEVLLLAVLTDSFLPSPPENF